tara:strand:+ start:1288 stop:1503 length:216 start_codon:yes stop_codon:yes gene_type:complete
MTGAYLPFLRKKVPVNNLLHKLKLPLFLSKKTTPTMATLSKRYEKYEKEYYENKKLNRLSYEDFQKINWRR